jgi:lysophospholipid acyltransferase (LPLAT)-like uncharacterized protein
MLKSAFAKRVMINLAPKLVYYLLRVIMITCKKRVEFDERFDGRQLIYAGWHGELLLFPYFYKYYAQRQNVDRNIYLLISQHSDGELIARFGNLFGCESIRGSSSKGAVKSLVEAIRRVKSGYDLGVTPDGPKGPRHSVADGIAAVSAKTGVDIVCYNYNASKFWQLKSWDRFAIPKPFSTITFYAKYIDTKDMSVDEIKERVKKELMKNAI